MQHFKTLHKTQHIAMLPKLMLKEGLYRTFHPCMFINTENSDNELALLKFRIGDEQFMESMSCDNYDSFESNLPRGKIVFNYYPINDPTKYKNRALIDSKQELIIHKKLKDINNVVYYKGVPILKTMDLHEYKGISFNENFTTANFKIKVINNNKETTINALVAISDKSYEITFYLMNKDNPIKIFSIIDTLHGDPNYYDLTSFTRQYFDGLRRLMDTLIHN